MTTQETNDGAETSGTNGGAAGPGGAEPGATRPGETRLTVEPDAQAITFDEVPDGTEVTVVMEVPAEWPDDGIAGWEAALGNLAVRLEGA